MTTTLDRPSTCLLASGLLGSGTARRAEFAGGHPFPHVVIDDCLDTGLADDLDFPAVDWNGWERYRDEYQRGKLICSDVAVMPERVRALVQELSAPRFLGFLRDLTGIDALLPDPYLEGGGLHASGPGATLTPHTDFHVYTRLSLYRRLNVLLYLNPGWDAADGGALELYEPDSDFETPVRSIEPTWGRMVVFRTDDRSPHGFTRPVAPDRLRRSIALYYYTSTETDGFAGDTNTYWKTHGDAANRSRRARLAAYRTLLTGSRALSMLAHRCNPNLGSKVRPER